MQVQVVHPPQALKLVAPFLKDPLEKGGLGLSTAQYGIAYGTIGIIFLTIGGLAGGYLISRLGLKRCLWLMVFAVHLPDLVFVYLSQAQPTNFYLISAFLAIEQFGAPDPHRRHQPCQRHLGRIGHAAEHAFAEEGPPERHAIEPADQLAVMAAFDRMGMAAIEQLAVKIDNRFVDPALGMSGSGRRTGPHYFPERRIGADLECFRADCPREPLRYVKTVKWQHGAQPRV